MPIKIEIKASRTLKWLYCLTLAGFIVTGVALSFSRIGYTSGGLFRYGLTVAILIFILSSMRMVHVIRHPQALDVFAPSKTHKWMRSMGVFLMWVGLAGVVGLLFPTQIQYLTGFVHVYLIQYSYHYVI